MPLALALLTVFSLITGTANATVVWSGFTGQADGFQRGDRITNTHMNEIDAALDSIKADLDPISSGQGDYVQISGVDIVNLNIIPGDGIDIIQAGSNPVAATFAVDLHATGPGLSFTGGKLSLLRTCTTNQVLAWNGTQWACAAQSSGGSTLTVDGGSTITSPNFITGTGGAGFLDVDFVQATNDISGQIAMSSITTVGTLTATTIGDLLTLSVDGITFTGSTAGYTCAGGTGGIYYDGTNMRMCDNGADVLVNQGNVNADEIYVEGVATVDGNNRLDLRGGSGVTATLDAGQTPDRVTFAVDLNGTVDGTGSSSNLSGLEFTATNELAILQGCSNGDTIAWNESSSLWECGARTTGSSSVQVGGAGTIGAVNLTDTSTVNVTDTSGTVTFDVIGTGITSLGTLTTELVVSGLGAEFIAGDTLTNCSTFTSTNGGIFYDDSEGKFKKCQDNVLSDLAPDVNNITGNLDVAGTGNLTVAGDITVSGAVSGTAGKVNINGDADQPQLVVEGHSSQSTNPDLLVVQTSAGTDLFTVNNSGRAKAKDIYDIDSPGVWRIQDAGDAYFTAVGSSGSPSTWFISTAGQAVFDKMIIGADIADTNSTIKIGGEVSQRQLLIKGAPAQADGTPVFEIENGGSTAKTTQIFQNGVIRAESIQDISGPGTNWNIPTNGAAIFDSITDNAGTPTWSISNVGDASLNKALIGDQNPFNPTFMYNSFNPVPTAIVASENALQTAMVVTAHSSSDGTNVLHPYVFRVDRERLSGGANYPLFTVDPDGTIFADAIQPHDALPNWFITENGVAAFTQVRAAGISGVAGMGFDVTDFLGATPLSGGYPDVVALGDNNANNNADADMDMVCGTDASGFIGCDLNWYVGRQMSGSANPVPELQIIDRIKSDGSEKNYITNNEPIVLQAPILAGDTGTPGIDLATGTIQGGVQVNNIAAPSTITNPKGQWYFVTSAGGTITLGSATRGTAVGQNVCVHATTTGVINIQPYSTDFKLVFDGVQYNEGASTAPILSSSGAAGDFVCLLLANPSTTQPIWYVLGRSGTWTAANGS
jgi:hypothetical protein